MRARTSNCFFVPGIPKPKGSMSGFSRKGSTKVAMVHSNSGTKGWQAAVAAVAREHLAGLHTGPVELMLSFGIPSPKRPRFTSPAVQPDLDKLVRCVLDALEGVAYDNDSRVIAITAKKEYSVFPGVRVRVTGFG